MVDFNSEGTLGTNRSHILDLIVLQRRDEFLNAYELLRVSVLQNTANTSDLFFKLRAKAESLFLELVRPLARKLGAQNKKDNTLIDFDGLKKLVFFAKDSDDLLKAYNVINGVLDDLTITRIDNRTKIDFTNIELSNYSKGL